MWYCWCLVGVGVWLVLVFGWSWLVLVFGWSWSLVELPGAQNIYSSLSTIQLKKKPTCHSPRYMLKSTCVQLFPYLFILISSIFLFLSFSLF